MRLHAELAAELIAVGREPGSARICAVSKFHPREAVQAAVAAGLTDFGESYAQEATAKLGGFPGITKHFIGHVQTNKAKLIAGGFDLIHSIDRMEAGLAVAKAMQALGRGVRVLVQVNISPTDRYGVPPREAATFATALRRLELDVDGVMAIGPMTNNREELRASFEEAARCFSEVGGSTFSLGMSGDWREAIAAGSTLIRIGTAIFGPRAPLNTTKSSRYDGT